MVLQSQIRLIINRFVIDHSIIANLWELAKVIGSIYFC